MFLFPFSLFPFPFSLFPFPFSLFPFPFSLFPFPFSFFLRFLTSIAARFLFTFLNKIIFLSRLGGTSKRGLLIFLIFSFFIIFSFFVFSIFPFYFLVACLVVFVFLRFFTIGQAEGGSPTNQSFRVCEVSPATLKVATILEALQEQPDWEGLPADRWPGPEAVTFSTGYQLSPTQPVTRRSKAAPPASGQTVSVKSPPPNVSGGTASYLQIVRNRHSHRTILRQTRTGTSCKTPAVLCKPTLSQSNCHSIYARVQLCQDPQTEFALLCESLGVSCINHILWVHGHTILQEKRAAAICDEGWTKVP